MARLTAERNCRIFAGMKPRRMPAPPISVYFHGTPRSVSEYRFHPPRRWRFDIAWPDHKIAVEQDGGIWTGGRHTRGAGFARDMEKMNYAARDGWRVFRFTPQQIRSGEAYEFIRGMFT